MKSACLHPIAQHVHGTHACYVLDRCRCSDCRQANTEYQRRRQAWLGEFPREPAPLVDAAEARAIVQRMKSRGLGLKAIAEQSGVAHGTLWKLWYGKPGSRPSRRVRRETLRRLRRLEAVAEPRAGAKIDAAEAWRIIDELVRRGWTKTAIAQHVHGVGARSLQVSRHLVFYRTLVVLRGLLDRPVPPRGYGRHGFRAVPSASPEPSRLVCGLCGRHLVDHSITERCW